MIDTKKPPTSVLHWRVGHFWWKRWIVARAWVEKDGSWYHSISNERWYEPLDRQQG